MVTLDDLDHATHAFAGRRMDRAIQRALAGKAVERVEEETAAAKGIDAHLPPSMRDD